MKNFFKSGKFFWSLVFVLFALMMVETGLYYYGDWVGKKDVEELNDALNNWIADYEAKKAVDTLGGATPKETLQMFIDAVEKGDYELASRYFIIDKQEKWKNNLNNIKEADKSNLFLAPLNKALNSEGGFSSDNKKYFIHEPVLVSFELYPSGNWKIDEI